MPVGASDSNKRAIRHPPPMPAQPASATTAWSKSEGGASRTRTGDVLRTLNEDAYTSATRACRVASRLRWKQSTVFPATSIFRRNASSMEEQSEYCESCGRLLLRTLPLTFSGLVGARISPPEHRPHFADRAYPKPCGDIRATSS